MKRFFYLLVGGALLFGSCKASKNESIAYKVQNAYWYNWVGGQPGVGGTNYEVHLDPVANPETQFEHLIVDGDSIPINKTNTVNTAFVLYASQNKSNLKQDVAGGRNARKPNLRQNDPETASITGRSKGIFFSLPISSFENKPAQNYP